MLAPGSTATVSYTASISGYLKNFAAVTATPSLPDGTPVTDSSDVTDSDPSAVGETFDSMFGGPTVPGDGPGDDNIPGEGTGGGIPGDDNNGIPDPMDPDTGIPDPVIPGDGDEPNIPGEGTGTPTPPDAEPSLSIENTVYLGDDLGVSDEKVDRSFLLIGSAT